MSTAPQSTSGQTEGQKINEIRPEFYDTTIPPDKELKPGVLYISRKFETAIHLCCCGCGDKAVTPWHSEQTGWKFIKSEDETHVTLQPSILNRPCNAHYFITNNKVIWC